jgi:hypothetical protein
MIIIVKGSIFTITMLLCHGVQSEARFEASFSAFPMVNASLFLIKDEDIRIRT